MRTFAYYFILSSAFTLITNCIYSDKSITINFADEACKRKWALEELNQELPKNWSTYKYLTFDIYSSSTQRFTITLFDTAGPRNLILLPFQNIWVRVSIPLIHFQEKNVIGHDMAAVWKIPLPGMCVNFTGTVGSIDNLDSIGFDMDKPLNSPYLKIKNLQLTMNAKDSILGPIPAVNEFGQWIHDETNSFFKSSDELNSRWSEDDKEKISGNFGFSKYGGFIKERVKGTGFFRTEKLNGKWWLIDPEGYLFYSIGSTGINPGMTFSRTKGREYIYNSLPPSIMSTGNRTEVNSFYTWNLTRRYGEDEWIEKWMEKTIDRMNRWGFNTIANWSDPTLSQSQKKAYVKELSGWGFNDITMGMPDPYDPKYIRLVDLSAKTQCEPLKDDPFLIGYFVGNEPPWPERENELIEIILQGEPTPLQSALKTHLSEKDTPEIRREFVYETYEKFIKIINSSIKKYDPNHLNLGLRLGGDPPIELIQKSANVGFDVYSINFYGYSVDNKLIDTIHKLTNIPIIIGEFHFGTPGRGLAPGLAQTINQKERGIAYSYYVENAAAHPAIVGTHWFQWLDQPSTGRFDGENYNIGFINVTDLPYLELIKGAIITHEKVLDIRLGNIIPTNQQPLIEVSKKNPVSK